MNKLRPLYLFSIVLLCSLFIFSVQYGGRVLLLKVFDTTNGFQEGTFVGTINVSGQVHEQAQLELQTEAEQWLSEPQLQIAYNGTAIPLMPSLFQFDIVDSIKGITDGGRSTVTVTLDGEQLRSLLTEKVNADLMQRLDVQKLEQEIIASAASLTKDQTFSLLSFINKEEAATVVSTGAVQHIAPYAAGLQEWMKHYETLTVLPKSRISLLKLMEDEAKPMNIDNESLSVIASLIYETIIPTNFQIVQRGISRELPRYAELGAEARIEHGGSDFIFYNSSEEPYALRFQLHADEMTAKLEGVPFLYTFKVSRSGVAKLPKKVLLHEIVPGKTDVATAERAGKDGYTVKVYREAYEGTGKLVTRELVADDYYLQVNEVQWIAPTEEKTSSAESVTDASQSQVQQSSSTDKQSEEAEAK